MWQNLGTWPNRLDTDITFRLCPPLRPTVLPLFLEMFPFKAPSGGDIYSFGQTFAKMVSTSWVDLMAMTQIKLWWSCCLGLRAAVNVSPFNAAGRTSSCVPSREVCIALVPLTKANEIFSNRFGIIAKKQTFSILGLSFSKLFFHDLWSWSAIIHSFLEPCRPIVGS